MHQLAGIDDWKKNVEERDCHRGLLTRIEDNPVTTLGTISFVSAKTKIRNGTNKNPKQFSRIYVNI